MSLRHVCRLPVTIVALVMLALGGGVPLTVTAHTPATVVASDADPTFLVDGAHLGGVTLRLAALGRGDVLAPIAQVQPSDDGRRVEYAHGDVTEWYLRQSGGVEQGVTLATHLTGDGPLALTIATPGVIPLVDAEGSGATLILPQAAGRSEQWRYDGLQVKDATGRMLPSHFALEAGGVRIVVDDAEAVYPVVVDPFVRRQTLTDPGNANLDYFGVAVALSGDGNTLAVGAYGTSRSKGAAYVYTRASGGSFSATPATTLADPGLTSNDYFGRAIALSRDGATLAVGAYGTSSSMGATYVYTRAAGGSFPATPTTTLTDPGNMTNDAFGNAVALSGDGTTLAVGAWSITGAAYVYTRAAGGSFATTPATTLADPNTSGNDFGYAVALSGDGTVLAVGAWGTNSFKGAAYVYTRAAGGSFATTPATTLTDPGLTSNDYFGRAIALSGDGATLAVGAYGTSSSRGATYVYTRAAGSGFYIAPATILTDPGNTNYDSFGFTMALSGDGTVLAVGAHGASNNKGAVDVYTRAAGTNFPAARLTTLADSSNVNISDFGEAVALSGDSTTLAVGTSTSGGKGAVDVYANPPGVTAASAPQSATVNTVFATPLAVYATDSYGVPLIGVSVTFTAPAFGAGGAFAGGMTTATVTTDAGGVATAPAFTANLVTGAYPVAASVTTGGGTATTTFSLTNAPDAPSAISVFGGANQSAVLGRSSPRPSPCRCAIAMAISCRVQASPLPLPPARTFPRSPFPAVPPPPTAAASPA